MVSSVCDCISSKHKSYISDVKVENMKHLTNIIHKCLYDMVYIYRHFVCFQNLVVMLLQFLVCVCYG